MFTLLAAILHLGNIKFKKVILTRYTYDCGFEFMYSTQTDNEDAVSITDLDPVNIVSSLLKVSYMIYRTPQACINLHMIANCGL